MRSLIIGLVVFLAACNGSTTEVQKIPYTDPQVTAKIDALTQALADATHTQAQQALSLGKLSLIGKVHGVSTSIRMQGEFRAEAIAAPNFGPCADMGVLIGRGVNNFSDDTLSSTTESFQQCTGYEYSVDMATLTLSLGPRLFWDGPNCTGNMMEWPSGGGAYNSQTLDQGVVFLNPADGETRLVVVAGQTPQPMQIQSVWVSQNPGCQSDIETQIMYIVRKVAPDDNFGIPVDFGKFQLNPP